MTEPKFHVGQHVAVCSQDGLIVIPKTIVTAVRYESGGMCFDLLKCQLDRNPKGWAYRVAHGGVWPDGDPIEFLERSLSPIDSNAEYLDSEQEQEVRA